MSGWNSRTKNLPAGGTTGRGELLNKARRDLRHKMVALLLILLPDFLGWLIGSMIGRILTDVLLYQLLQ